MSHYDGVGAPNSSVLGPTGEGARLARVSEAVIAVARRRARALADRDWQAVRDQLHPDFRYTTASGTRLGREQYLDFLENGPLRWKEQRLEAVDVLVDGDVAVLLARVVDDVTMGKERAELRFATTQVYLRVGGNWMYLAGHTAAQSPSS